MGPEREDRERAVQGGEMHWMADAKRADGAPRSDVHKQQREGSRHGGQKRRAQREGAEGSQERTGGRTHRGNVQDDSINGTARDPAGSFSGDDDTGPTEKGDSNGDKEEEIPEEENTGGRIEGWSTGNGTGCSG